MQLINSLNDYFKNARDRLALPIMSKKNALVLSSNLPWFDSYA